MTVFTGDCVSCKPIDITKANRTIFTTRNCRVFLKDDQSWLGRSVISLKRHVTSFAKIRPYEQQDIYECIEKISKAYRRLFGMVREDWIQSVGFIQDSKDIVDFECTHLYYDIVPRFHQPQNYVGKKFSDISFRSYQNIGQPYVHQKEVLSYEELLKLKNDIQKELIAQDLISEKNLKETNPSCEILELCKMQSKSKNESDNLPIEGIIAAVDVMLELTRSRL